MYPLKSKFRYSKMETSSEEFIEDYYQDFIREIVFPTTGAAYIWVVSFNRWLPGIGLPKKAILKGLINASDYEFQREVQLLKEASQKTRAIVKYYYHIRNNINRWIFMEYCEKGSLTNFIEKQREKGTHFTYSYIVWEFYWIAEALAWLHNSKMYHRDIKPDNIFVSDVEILKLGDFGASRYESFSTRSSNTVIGTEFYMSPNLLDKFGLGKTETKSINPLKDDVWALGKTMLETIALQPGIDFRWKQESDIMASINENYEKVIPLDYQPQLKNLIRLMMGYDESSRIDMQNVAHELYKIIQSLRIDSFQTLAHDAPIVILSPRDCQKWGENKVESSETTLENYSNWSLGENNIEDWSQTSISNAPITEESELEPYKNCVFCNNFIGKIYFELECKHIYHKECMKKHIECIVVTEKNYRNLLCAVCPTVLDLKRIIHADLGLSQVCVLQIFKLTWRGDNTVCPSCKEKSKNSILSSELSPHFIRCENCQQKFCSFCRGYQHKKCYTFDAYLETYLSIYEGRNRFFDLSDAFK
ncbi:unnamed protein product [Blepharisma stoltei]|uniref:Protein kinase domain-containing protein n=1 Tax=Blepharisma stoltei TaxID=1481888 RepID=A0AAU9K1K3_9CILI|nr:unnamed protein product [Blepharisma stoltei]